MAKKASLKTNAKELTGAQDLYNFLFEACNITGQHLRNYPKKDGRRIRVSNTPLYLQEQFEKIYNQADKSEFELRQAIEKIDKVMKSLLQ